MDESSSGGSEDKKVTRVNSFTKILRSPSRTSSSKSKSTSSSPLSRLNPAKLFSRKNSGLSTKGESESGRGSNAPDEAEAEGREINPSSLIDSVTDAIQVVKDVVDEKSAQALTQMKDEVNSVAKSVESFTEIKEKKFNYLDKAMDGLEKTMEELKDKAKAGVETATKVYDKEIRGKTMEELKDRAKEVFDREIRGRSKDINEKTPIGEVEASNVVDQAREEATGAVDMIQSTTKEDDCVTSLAQGLQKVCAPWSIKKED